MLRLSDDEARILVKRIAKVIRKARYRPAEVQDEEAAASEVVRPYMSRAQSGAMQRPQAERTTGYRRAPGREPAANG